jgi:hypothetical protein
MSYLTPKPPREYKPATATERNAYQREYHKKHREYLNEMERTRHYKAKYPEALDEEFCGNWGSASGDVWKVWLEVKPLIKAHPELKEHLCKFLGDMSDKEIIADK